MKQSRILNFIYSFIAVVAFFVSNFSFSADSTPSECVLPGDIHTMDMTSKINAKNKILKNENCKKYTKHYDRAKNLDVSISEQFDRMSKFQNSLDASNSCQTLKDLANQFKEERAENKGHAYGGKAAEFGKKLNDKIRSMNPKCTDIPNLWK